MPGDGGAQVSAFRFPPSSMKAVPGPAGDDMTIL